MEGKTVKITDAYLRKLVGEPGKTKKITIGGGLTLWVTINRAGKTARTWYLRYYDDTGNSSGQNSASTRKFLSPRPRLKRKTPSYRQRKA